MLKNENKIETVINPNRIRSLFAGNETNGPIVYWMSRDQRAHDNWAMLFAQQLAEEKKKSLLVVFNLQNDCPDINILQYGFMLKGLSETEKELSGFNIPFRVLTGNPIDNIPSFLKEINASILVTDFNPLKINLKWKDEIVKRISIPFYEVDAHNIVPAFYVSGKQEFSARTIRPKIKNLLPEFLEEYPLLNKMKKSGAVSFDKINWNNILSSLKINFEVKEIDSIKPGTGEAIKVLTNFLHNKLDKYSSERNDPNNDAQSNLSPYLHFGQISAQRIALKVKQFNGNQESSEAFLEELIIRRELADNFCFYNNDYDSFAGFHKWAKETLNEHRNDEREFIYSLEQFEKSQTHEDLWNAAQTELLLTGKMHGYMRMYWAKKILEWTKSPEDALAIAIYLNDKYSLDGRDPNGYTGCAWSIGGVHDRAWGERNVFGKIRYMNRNGAKSKFDIKEYIGRYL